MANVGEAGGGGREENPRVYHDVITWTATQLFNSQQIYFQSPLLCWEFRTRSAGSVKLEQSNWNRITSNSINGSISRWMRQVGQPAANRGHSTPIPQRNSVWVYLELELIRPAGDRRDDVGSECGAGLSVNGRSRPLTLVANRTSQISVEKLFSFKKKKSNNISVSSFLLLFSICLHFSWWYFPR